MDDATLELIIRYLDDEMSVEEKSQFEEQVKTDPGLQESLVLQQEINAAFQEPQVEALERDIREIVQAGRSENTGSIASLRSWRSYAIAAVLLIALGLGFWLVSPPSRSPLNEFTLAQISYPEQLNNPLQLRSLTEEPGTQQPVQQAFEEIEQLYQAGSDKEAQARLATLLAQFPGIAERHPEMYQYVKGILALKTRDPSTAIEAFRQITTGPYAESARWYQTLARLATEGPTSRVTSELTAFTRYPNPYQNLAQQLLDR